MKHEQQQQAENLYFQTDLSMTKIAETIGVSRRSLHYWVRENNWEYLKKTGEAMPTMIVGNCFQAMARLSDHISSYERRDKPITREEVDSLYKLTLTINKLKARVALNESMETFAGFIEALNDHAPELAEAISPFVSRYVASCAYVNEGHKKAMVYHKPKTNIPEEDLREAELDKEDLAAWEEEKAKAEKEQPAAPAPSSVVNTRPDSVKAEQPKAPKVDIRKQLRGTATKGPCKVLREKRLHGCAA